MTSEISRDEVRSAIEDKLCAYFGITDEQATEDLLTFKICNSRLEERKINQRFGNESSYVR